MTVKDLDPVLPTGTVLGHWRVEHLLGEGGMGRVYRAEHAAMGRKVALKVLKKSLAKSAELVERFFAEAHAVNRIRHPGIVEVTDCFIAEDGTPCIVMELLIGRTISEEMAAKRIHPARVAAIGAEVASALDAAHKAGVIHRDLKPDNLFLVDAERAGDEATVKVLDFGVAKLMDPMPNSTVHTVVGSIMGTPDYMAPEQLAGKPVDARADIYALGASLYHACTGRPPFQATNFGDLVVMHMTKPPTPPSCFANLPPVLEQVLLAMLEKEPARRPQTMGDVALLLRSAQRLGTAPGEPAALPPADDRPRARAPSSPGTAPFVAHGPVGPPPAPPFDTSSYLPSGTLLLGSAEAPEIVEPPLPAFSSWFAQRAAPRPRPATPAWAWATVTALLCLALAGAAATIGARTGAGRDRVAAGLLTGERAAERARVTAGVLDSDARDTLDPFALGGLAVLEAPGAADNVEGAVRSDASELTSTLATEPGARAFGAERRDVVKRKPARAHATPRRVEREPARVPVRRAVHAPDAKAARRAVLDPFEQARDAP